MSDQSDVRRIALSLPGAVPTEGRFGFAVSHGKKAKGFVWAWLERIDPKKGRVPSREVVAVEVEMVIPPDDPSEPCYESETVELVREVAEHAERGDADWLARHGQVFERNASANPL